jgi:hypothetical protein
MPAISVVRENGRRTQCQSNLRQIGDAISEYLTAQRIAPISISPYNEGPKPAAERSGKGWIVSILPHLELTNLQKDLVQTGDFFSGGGLQDPNFESRAALAFNVNSLKCPNDGQANDLIVGPPDFTVPNLSVASTNYKGVAGDPRVEPTLSIFLGTEPDCHNTSPCNGVFFRNSYQFPKRWERFSDGTANTFIVGEDLPRHNRRSVWCFANGDWGSTHIPLNYKPEPATPDDYWNVMGFRSDHPGGVNFLIGDGQVRFIPTDVDYSVYRALGTRDNHKNEVLVSGIPQ